MGSNQSHRATGNSGMGLSKHRKSGVAPRNRRAIRQAQYERQRHENEASERDQAKENLQAWTPDVKELFGK